MSRKEAILNLREVLIKRRDALRRVLAGDLSSLKEYKAQASGDVVDAALDTVQDEISSQLAEVESRELARTENALERMRDGQYGACEGLRHQYSHGAADGLAVRQRSASNASARPNARGFPAALIQTGAAYSTRVFTKATSRSAIWSSTSPELVEWVRHSGRSPMAS